jgi:hypothetical protein
MSISGLAYWWDATDATTRTVATGVSSWRDKVASVAATQSTGASQPLVNATIGGKTAFTWDSGDLLLASTSYLITAQSTFCVFSPDATGAFNRIVAQESDAQNATYINLLMSNQAGVFQVGSYIGGGFRSGVTIAQSANVIGESHHDGTAVTVLANGISGTPYTVSLSFSPTKIALGNSAGGVATFFGRISEVLIWNRAMNTSERLKARKYLSSKYGIATA